MSKTTSVNSTPATNASDVARLDFILRSVMSGLRTAMPVKVISVTNSGGVSPIGTVNVQPMVHGVASDGAAIPHGTIYNVPYMRIQGGTNAIILDPQVGDIGIATVCDRDISTVKNSKASNMPGSTRKNDMSDMVYLMSIITVAPTQYVQFNTSGITIVTPGTLTIQANSVSIQAPTVGVNSTSMTIQSPTLGITSTNVTSSGTWAQSGTMTVDGTNVHTHRHSGVTAGGSNTGTPV